jgi:hypothetical protein
VLAVSDKAAQELRQTLDEVATDVAFRLVSSEDGFVMRLDSPSEQDRVIESEERMVLMVAPDVDGKLSGVILDLQEEDQPTLTLRRVEESC